MKLLSSLLFLMICFSLGAREIHYLMRSPKALLMGDAYTARADDEYTLFYNPAALGRHKGVSMTFINPDFGVTNALDEMDRFKDFPSSDASAISQRLMGFPVYLKAAATPSLKFAQMGLNLFVSSSTSMILRNAVHPVMEMNYRLDRGFVAGGAFSFGHGAKSTGFGPSKVKTTSAGSRTNVGFGVKNMNRQGISKSFDLFGSTLYSEIIGGIDSDDATGLRKILGYSYGKGWGFDLGAEHIWSSGASELSFGLSILDVFDTKFKKISGDEPIPRQEQIVSTGVTWRQNFFLLDYAFSVDLHPLLEPIPTMRKLHMGFEVGIPLVRGYAGWNGGYLSYGLEFNLWPISILAGFYGVELGSNYRQEKGSRAIIYLKLLDFSFEG